MPLQYKKTKSLEIQEAVPQHQSIRMRLSNHSWEWGVSNFFLNNVPFSFTTGKLLASGIAHLIHYFFTHSPTKSLTSFHGYELGAGTGLLSKNILDCLRENYPSLYKKCTMHVSDSAESIVSEIQKYGLFNGHSGHYSVSAMDGLDPQFVKKADPHLIVCSYFLDSVPMCHIEYHKGTLSEIWIRTVIPKDACIIDATSFPPKILDARKIKKLLLHGDPIRKRILSTKLLALLEEEVVYKPIHETGLSPKDVHCLNDFCVSLSLPQLRFNYGPFLSQWLQKLYNTLPRHGMVVIVDFGRTDPSYLPPVKGLISSYAATAFSAVSFPLLRFIAKTVGFSSIVKGKKEGHSHVLLLSKGFDERHLSSFFTKKFAPIHCENIDHAIVAVTKESDSEKLPKQIKDKFNSLSPLEQVDYSLLTQFSLALLKKGHFKEALDYAKKSAELYPTFAIGSFELMGYIKKETGDLEGAEAEYQKVLTLAPEFSNVYLNLAFIYSKKKDFSRYIECMLRYFPYAESDIWEHLITMALISLQRDEPQRCQHILNFIFDTLKKYPSLVPENIGAKAKQVKEFLNEMMNFQS